MTDWVCCKYGRGRLVDSQSGITEAGIRHFKEHSVGVKKDVIGDHAVVWLIGADETWHVPVSDIKEIEVEKTGDKFPEKICNICHCLLPTSDFAPNQTNKHGLIRRPSCQDCRVDIDMRAPRSAQAQKAEKNRPKKGSPFKCPICRKRSIAGITAKVVADHNHRTGDIRGFICDSCNTGLGRFKNGKYYLKNALIYIGERED